ncbi:MAG: hypothetical protein HS130_05700 [Deltaproteobacteria bacterium]|nr:hypothetical protein [Deltaproteobacteria bacterium]MCL4873191.1 hypothetical protein [bacterium]
MSQRIRQKMRRNAFYLFASLFALISTHGSAGAGVSAGYAADFIKASWTNAVVLRYDHRKTRLGAQAMYWDGPFNSNSSLSIDYDVLPSEKWDLNLGGAYLSKISEVNGTHFNFSLGAGVNLGERFRVQFTHLSNAHDNHNMGWNFLAFLVRF